MAQGGPIIPSSTCIGAPDYAGFFCDYAVNYLKQIGFTADQINTGGYTIKTTLDPHISLVAKQNVNARFKPNANGSFRIVVGAPAYAGGEVGAASRQAVAGATADLPGRAGVSFTDSRVKAALCLSPQGPGQFGLTSSSFATMRVPAPSSSWPSITRSLTDGRR